MDTKEKTAWHLLEKIDFILDVALVENYCHVCKWTDDIPGSNKANNLQASAIWHYYIS